MTTDQRFDVGDTVEWVSQAGASLKRKVGVVHTIIDAGKSPRDYGIAGDFGSPRQYTSYLIRVSTPRSHRLYWPHASLLDLVSRPRTDPPTPTSSLEEARQSVIRCETCKGRGGFSDTTMGRGGYGGQMLTGCRSCSGSGLDTRELEAFIEAAARAEVIREVEAALTNQDGCDCDSEYEADRGFAPRDAVDHAGDCPVMERWDEFRARLRALSQGGEANG